MKRKIIPNSGNVSSRILSLLLALIMVLGMVPGVALAADSGAGTGTTVYLKPNSNWTQANARFAVYYFDDAAGTNGWTDMSDPDGDGYYEATIPVGYSNIIFVRMNPNTSTNEFANNVSWNQTNNLTVSTDGKNCYTVADGAWSYGDGTWSIYTPVPFQATIHFQNSQNWSSVAAHIWNTTDSNTTWPGKEMTANTSNAGWYDVTVTSIVGSEIGFVFNNNDNGSQTPDFTITAGGEYWVTYDGTNISSVSTAPEGWMTEVVVHVKNTQNWSSIYGYAWLSDTNQTTLLGGWPGNAMTADTSREGWYDIYLAVPTGSAWNFIANNASGAQTQDIAIDVNQSEIWIKISYSESEGIIGTALYEAPSEWTTPMYTVAGSGTLCGNDWTPGDTTNQMTYNSETGLYEKVYTNVAAGEYAFKVTDGSWNNSWGGTGEGGNYDITVTAVSDVTITFNESTKAVNATVTPVTEEPEPEPEPDPVYYVAGDAALCGSNWTTDDPDNGMTDNGDGTHTKVYTNVAKGEYSFKVCDGTWTNSWGDGSNNYIFTVTTACDVTITFNENTKKITVTGTGIGQDTGLTITTMHAVGDGSGNWLGGKNWDPTANVMDETSDGVYEITFENVPARATAYEFKFAANGAWTHSWGKGTGNEAIYNSQTNYTLTLTATSNVTLKIDMTGYNHNTKTGATYSVTVTPVEGGGEEPDPVTVDYYLVGYINGADNDGNDYKFVDGSLTVELSAESYVLLKDSIGQHYIPDAAVSDATTATLKKGDWDYDRKVKVPSGKVTFTLTVNGDGTLTLSYTTVVDVPEIPEGYNTVTIHFLKPSTWGNTINAWIWDANGKIPGYEDYNTAWPGSAIPANADKAGWYDITVGTENPQAFNFIFNDGSSQTADLTTGEIDGPTELWVVDGTVYTEAPLEWTHYTATIHFQKPANWGSSINAYAWTDGDALLLDPWPGTVTSPSANEGWYNTTIRVKIGEALNFIFNDGANQTDDIIYGNVNGNIELWVSLSSGTNDQGHFNAAATFSAPDGWVDESRTIHLPGTLGNNNWNAAGNQMEYDAQRGLYTITFENVTPGTYEYKIAVNGAWAENYGANGEKDGGNMSVSVPTAQNVTFWYNDSTHRVVCSVDYDIDADITLSGTGIDETKLTDPELDGLYTVTVNLPADTYSDLTITHGDYTVVFSEFTLSSGKAVTFYYDPATGLAYHNGSDVKVETNNIYYTTKDLNYKDPFGAVAVGETVKFSITTGTDATGVALAIRGLGAVKMEKDGEAADGVQRWTCTTTFSAIGEYDYYFAITNGSDMVIYCDDAAGYNPYYKTGDYGLGAPGNPNDIFAYDLVVYEAGYETPDWMKNAVIYQIFPDRFFDGDETNNQAQIWARGTVDYEYITDWYLLPENPEMADDPNYPENAHKGDGNWSNEIYGGDLEGIVEKIDYLKALGVNVIYLNPVFWSISNHRYDAVSYTEIDPILGTLGDFEELVRVAEENDMHIILDGVFNHVSDDSVYFDRYYKFLPDAAEKYDGKIGAYPYWAYVYDYMNDNGASQADAEAAAKAYFSENYGITDYSYTEWFAVSSTPMVGSVDNIGLRAGKPVYSYEGWWGYDSMPVIYSTNGSEYQTGNWAEEIISGENSVNAYWISKGMDGWRLDVANEVSDETWQNFRDSVKALDSEAVIIGEIWADATHYLMGDMYDSVMNYVFRDAVAGFARGYLINRDDKTQKYDSDLTADEAMTILEILRERYPEEAFYAMMNLVASHDTSRILSYLDDVEDDRYQKDIAHAFPTYETTSERAKQLQYVVAFLQFTYAGAPTIYYGDEIGMVGGDDPDDRRAFTWGMGNQEIVEWYATLAAIRAAYPALRTGSVEPFSTGNADVMGFVRSDSDNTIVVLANRSEDAQTYELDGTWVDLVTGETFDGTILAYRGVILVAEDEVKEIKVNTKDLAPAYDPAYIVAERSETPPENPSEDDDTPPAPVGPTLYTITNATCENGKVTAQAIMASKGSTIKVSAVPAAGYKVWTLTVTDAAGNEIEIVDGKFEMPASNVTVSATFVYDLPYTDVADDAENYAAIAYMYETGLMIGTSTEEYIFNGDMTMTRAQIAMILYRLSGEPAVEYAGTFTDAPEGAWYTAAVEWAHAAGIVVGVNETEFAPAREITVNELAALIYRYAQCQQTGSCASTEDDWTVEFAAAMTWCVENGVLSEDVSASEIAIRYLAAEMFYSVYSLLNK